MVDVANSLFVEKSKVQGSALSKWPGAVEASTSSAPPMEGFLVPIPNEKHGIEAGNPML